MWFPVQKQVCQVQTSVSEANIPDPADLDMDYGYEEPDLCFSKSQVRDPAYALLDSGATHVLLPGHMLPKGARSFEVTVNLAVGKEKAKCWRNEVYAQERAHPLLPLGRLTNLLDTKFVWEDGTAVMQCRDKGKMAHDDEVRDQEQYGLCKPDAVRSATPSPLGSASSSRHSLQLAILGKSRTRSKDDFISITWGESEDV